MKWSQQMKFLVLSTQETKFIQSYAISQKSKLEQPAYVMYAIFLPWQVILVHGVGISHNTFQWCFRTSIFSVPPEVVGIVIFYLNTNRMAQWSFPHAILSDSQLLLYMLSLSFPLGLEYNFSDWFVALDLVICHGIKIIHKKYSFQT